MSYVVWDATFLGAQRWIRKCSAWLDSRLHLRLKSNATMFQESKLEVQTELMYMLRVAVKK